MITTRRVQKLRDTPLDLAENGAARSLPKPSRQVQPKETGKHALTCSVTLPRQVQKTPRQRCRGGRTPIRVRPTAMPRTADPTPTPQRRGTDPHMTDLEDAESREHATRVLHQQLTAAFTRGEPVAGLTQHAHMEWMRAKDHLAMVAFAEFLERVAS